MYPSRSYAAKLHGDTGLGDIQNGQPAPHVGISPAVNDLHITHTATHHAAGNFGADPRSQQKTWLQQINHRTRQSR